MGRSVGGWVDEWVGGWVGAWVAVFLRAVGVSQPAGVAAVIALVSTYFLSGRRGFWPRYGPSGRGITVMLR